MFLPPYFSAEQISLVDWHTIFEAISLFALMATVAILTVYTRETWRLRVETQKQTELQLRPFVVFEATFEGFQVRNIGNGSAINVQVKDFDLQLHNALSLFAHSSDPVPVLPSGDLVHMRHVQAWTREDDGKPAQRADDYWLNILKPLRVRSTEEATKDMNIRPKVRIEFQNVEMQWYFVEEILLYGGLEIIDSGKRQ